MQGHSTKVSYVVVCNCRDCGRIKGKIIWHSTKPCNRVARTQVGCGVRRGYVRNTPVQAWLYARSRPQWLSIAPLRSSAKWQRWRDSSAMLQERKGLRYEGGGISWGERRSGTVRSKTRLLHLPTTSPISKSTPNLAEMWVAHQKSPLAESCRVHDVLIHWHGSWRESSDDDIKHLRRIIRLRGMKKVNCDGGRLRRSSWMVLG